MNNANGFSLLETLVFMLLITLGVSIFQQTLWQLFTISENENANRRDLFRRHAELWMNSQPDFPVRNIPIPIPCPETPNCPECKNYFFEVYIVMDATGADGYFRAPAINMPAPYVELWTGPIRISFPQK